ncbi:MAG: TasA family protein [Dethiobacteria bacterium]
MRSKILVSILIIFMSAATIAGVTMAWFTAQTEIENTFTAGTVELESDETGYFKDPIENWNPGDCVEKKFKVVNKGSKKIYLRASFTGEWFEKNEDGEWIPWDPQNEDGEDVNPVEIKVIDDMFGSSEKWQELDGYFYYYNTSMGPWRPNPVVDSGGKAYQTIKVCLDGPTADNAFQGKRFVLSVKFEAVQSSNNAVEDVWGVKWVSGFGGGRWEKVAAGAN